MTQKNHIHLEILFLLIIGSACEDSETGPGEDATFRDYPTTCDVYNGQIATHSFAKEILITSTTVVEDACRTGWEVLGCGTKLGKWTAWALFQQMVDGADPSPLIHDFFKNFRDQPTVNGFKLEARTKALDTLKGWRLASGCNDNVDTPCSLEKKKSPFRLTAIVNRQDIRAGGYGDPAPNGEARLVFNILKIDPLNPNSPPTTQSANIIFEYRAPSPNVISVKNWAERWAKLGTMAFGAAFNDHLQTQLTDQFIAAANLAQVRTNENAFDLKNGPLKTWSLRESGLGCPPNKPACVASERRLLPRVVAQTPDRSINVAGLAKLSTYLSDATRQAQILNGTHKIAKTFPGPLDYFQGGESIASKTLGAPAFTLWGVDSQTFQMINISGNQPTRVRHFFGFQTCSGCHYNETRTDLMFIQPREVGFESQLAPFLTTPLNGKHTIEIEGFEGDPLWKFEFNEPKRRLCELVHAVTTGSATPKTQPSGAPH